MNLADIAQKRYATKKFDAQKRIPDDIFWQLKQLLRLSPSSVNSQPWHFIIADSPAGKQRLAKGAQGQYSANEAKILNASHVILFCSKTDLSDAYLQALLDNEDKEGRFPTPENKAMAGKVRTFYADLHRKKWNDAAAWMERQVYLNLGTLLLGAAMLGVDAVPIEGIDRALLNAEFDLNAQGYSASVVVALGYHAADDVNATLPKSRLPDAQLFTHLA